MTAEAIKVLTRIWSFSYISFMLPWSVFQGRDIFYCRTSDSTFPYQITLDTTIYICVNVSFISPFPVKE